MYFCYNLEKEEGSLKTELKNCLSLYKIFYSCAFILILCVIHPIIYYEEIGSAIQSPIAFLTIIFCSDTYLMEVKSKRADVFHLYDQKKQLKVISQRVGVQILYLLILSCVGYVLFYWQKPGSVNEGISGIQIFLLYFIAMFGTIWLWSICSVICVHCFEICGQVLDVYLELSLDLYQKREVHFSEIWDCFLSAFVNLLN